MDMQLLLHRNREISVNNWLEQVLLEIGDIFDIRIVWNSNTAVLAGVLAVTGGILGGLAGGRFGAALGTGIGGATGLGVSTVVSLREVWDTVKEKLKELLYIILNYIRRLDRDDYIRAYEVLMRCATSRKELVLTILEFIVQKLGTQVLSNMNRNALE